MAAQHALKARLNVGLIGLGRLGQVYARDLSSRLVHTRLAAVSDTDAELAKKTAAEFDVPRAYGDPAALIDDPAIDAVVICTPTHTHRDLAIAALERGRPTFCEKPLALSMEASLAVGDAVRRTGVFFQMGFMRRFDPGYAAAKARVEQGAIGTPVVFKSTSRDPFRPSLEYANPASSGGLLVDMGIHDFDLARWFMGEVATVQAVGGTLAYPEMKTVGDIDNAIASLVFADGRLGVIDLTRNGVYGYDICTELLGTAGTIRIGYIRETPILVMTKNSVAHDTVPYFMERFERAYTLQLQDFVENVRHERTPPVKVDDGIEALRVALAATRACQTGQPVAVAGAAAAGA
jgi:inositol 2-dehydrogenase